MKKYNKLIVAKKLGMTSHQNSDGTVKACTVLSLNNCQYFNISDEKIDVFNDVFVSFGDKDINKHNKPISGFLAKHKISSSRNFFKVTLPNNFVAQNSDIDFSIFNINEKVNVRSISKGNGFTGTIKKGFKRGLMTHGSKSKRLPGSIGAGTYPGHVFKGTTMGGRTGNSKVTIKNLTIIDIIDNLIFVSGAIPGKSNSVEIFN
jgi:large subunit ribosomal protein L3